MLHYLINRGNKIICFIYTSIGRYSKPFLYITDNGTGNEYFKTIANKFEYKLHEIGLQSLMCEFTSSSRIYRLPDDGWWNEKEERWYENEEWNETLKNIFDEITI